MTPHPPATARIRALYRDNAVLFDMPQTTTMGELAEILATVSREYGTPLHVEIAVRGGGGVH